MTDPAGYLLARIELLRTRVRRLVEERSGADPSAGDEYRGLYVPPETARWLAGGPGPGPVPDARYDRAARELADAAGSEARVHRLAAAFGLTDLDLEILLIAVAPDLDRSFEALYGYLNDDVSRRRASVGLALDLCGTPVTSAPGRARFAAGAPLIAGRLVTTQDADRPFLSRALHVPDRVAAFLLGDDAPDDELTGVVRLDGDAVADGSPPPGLAERLRSADPPLVYLHEPRPGAGVAAARSAAASAGLPVLAADPDRLDASLVPVVVREAAMRGAAVVAGPLPDAGALLRAFAEASAKVPVLLTGPQPFDPGWSEAQPLVLDVPLGENAAGAWRAELPDGLGFDLDAATATYRFTPDQVRRAVRAALDHAALDGVPLSAAHLHRGARLQNAGGLHKHARRIVPAVGWDDLVLPDEPAGRLRELIQRARHRDRVLGEWRLRSGGGRGRGVVALFAGDSGTGKTMSAEVLAGELGLDLYVVELSAVVDKYVGETEKNLERIFAEADRMDAVLLFDEADAVFGKRSDVRDARDRYANLESAYLLQRLESFGGIAVLTTNLRANIDDAFTRRLDIVVDFPFPDAAQRRALWEHCLAPPVPVDEAVDLDRCAREFELAGGAIRGAAVTAGYLAAAAGRPVAMADLLAGARREYRKLGRLLPGDVPAADL
ncbi:ATP-binding protein [Actinomadura decatromicini]|uniref:ATP-binding protein n=1 Tax=Actinomadura decatromicini TaxID=2604572 RepID=A0A5D3FTB8_9ACTN|nr:ATP-binding protein [Actinomadura decatromicini]TYK51324.1 ATP-binding protein [Actinomadura decatromicini]